MTEQEFRQLKEGEILFDDKYSRRRGQLETVTVVEHSKITDGIILRDNIGEITYSYDTCWNYDVMPDDRSSLPFY